MEHLLEELVMALQEQTQAINELVRTNQMIMEAMAEQDDDHYDDDDSGQTMTYMDGSRVRL